MIRVHKFASLMIAVVLLSFFRTHQVAAQSVHLTLGNPSGAVTSTSYPTNYLMQKTQYAMSYHRDNGTPNWVSWHLGSSDLGSAPRSDNFSPDSTLPSGWYQVTTSDYTGSGYDRGHMTPSADRTSSTTDNAATFLMTNIVPQHADNNQGPWADLENYIRGLVVAGDEAYILSGGHGSLGTIAGGKVRIPERTWKIIVLLDEGTNDLSRITTSTRVIAINMPNTSGIRYDDWEDYRVSVDSLETLTGYDFLSAVSTSIQSTLESQVDGGGGGGGGGGSSELFFSEYIEGSSNNKALEIYNGTGASVDLGAGSYSVAMYANGASTATSSVNLSGSLANNDVYVIANASASTTILNLADITNAVAGFNGDDAVALLKNGVIVDVIGQIGYDPGTEWGTGSASTVDNTIRRKSTIASGDSNASNAFDPATEWDGYANDTFDGLGAHTGPAAPCVTNLFFSEYIEGSSNNKALEIYNGTGATVDLGAGGYTVALYSNGSASATSSVNLSGSLADGDVYVIANASASTTILNVADTTNAVASYNGDDAMVLLKNGIILDVIGQVGYDPGTEWGTGNASTVDNTIRRKATITAGDTDGSGAFDPATEWDGYALDTFGGLGAHSITCP